MFCIRTLNCMSRAGAASVRRPLGSRLIHSTASAASGHSKWQTIKHDKMKNDDKRNKLNSRFASMLMVAVKAGGPDPTQNAQLASVIEQANKNNVPKKTIESAITKASGGGSAGGESVLYEGMGPGGVAVLVEALTDNRSRTVGFVKSTFTKCGGSMSNVQFLFDKRGYIILDRGEKSFEDVFERIAELGADDIEEEPQDGNDRIVAVYTEPSLVNGIAKELKAEGYTIKDVGTEYAPKEESMVEVPEHVEPSVKKLLRLLDDIDDVTDIYTNAKNDLDN